MDININMDRFFLVGFADSLLSPLIESSMAPLQEQVQREGSVVSRRSQQHPSAVPRQ
jgi:hypothetical protein